MLQFSSLIHEEDHFGLKVFGTEEICYIKWLSEWGWDDAYKHMYPEFGTPVLYDFYEEINDLLVMPYYLIKCDITKKEYLLITYYGMSCDDDLKYAICVQNNIFNVFSIWKEFGEIAIRTRKH